MTMSYNEEEDEEKEEEINGWCSSNNMPVMGSSLK